MRTNLNVRISKESKTREYLIKIDADKFERLAASLGFFGDGFLKSVERAEKEIREKKTRKLGSLKELSKK